MPQIQVNNLSFCYDGSFEPVFENVSFSIDTNWKLGFIARNGRGKTTFLNLLQGKYPYEGQILSDSAFDYFPFSPPEGLTGFETLCALCPDTPTWQLEREAKLLEIREEALYVPFENASKGEQTKIMLCALFAGGEKFLLIDEPTNHLDALGRKSVANYLKKKRGFILVSHDRDFLDEVCDHVLVINKKSIEVQKGNFSSWWENKKRQDQFEQTQNDRLTGQIDQLTQAMRRSEKWAEKVEKTKYSKSAGGDINRGFVDKGFIGAQSKRMMQRAKATQTRIQNAIDEKSALLQNIEKTETLKLHPLKHRAQTLVSFEDACIAYDGAAVFAPLRFSIANGERIALFGANGCGKSSIIRAILGELPKNADISGTLRLASGLKISYCPQDAAPLAGFLGDLAAQRQVDRTLLYTILRKLDFTRPMLERDCATYSAGQKKKVLLALSLCESAHLYIWDEPLNYIDVFSRMQIEQLIEEFSPTLLFVEHDAAFARRIATKTVSPLKQNC